MSHLSSTPLIARAILLAGVLLAILVLLSPSHFPAYAQGIEMDEIEDYPENGTHTVAAYTAMDPEGEDIAWSLDGTDAADFDIQGGVLTFNSPPDYEDPTDRDTGDSTASDNIYDMTVVAADSDTGGMMRTVTVTVTVTNEEEPGTVTLPTLQPLEGISITATLTDPDGQPDDVTDTDLTDEGTTTWQWARSSSENGPWTDIEADAEADPSVTSDSATYTPGPDDVESYLRATATYTDGESEDETDTKTAPVVSANPVLKNLVNDAPVFNYAEGDEIPDDNDNADKDVGDEIPDGTALQRKVEENSETDTPVGNPVAAYDDDDDTLTYTLGGTNASLFTIDVTTGQIRLGNVENLNYDQSTPPTYTLTVEATDPSLESDTITVTVVVINVPEKPSISPETPTVGHTTKDHPERRSPQPQTPLYTPNVSTYDATDDEDDVATNDDKELTWSLSGNDSDKFELSESSGSNTELRFKSSTAPDFESPTDSGTNNVYNVTVTVTDSDGMTDSRNVAVTIRNVDEPGTITLSHPQPEVGARITAELTDPDDGETSVTWQWYAVGTTEATGSGSTSATYTPTEDDGTNSRTLRVTATYTDRHGPDKMAEVTSASGVQPLDSNDLDPEFTDDQGSGITREVEESATVGDSIGTPVTATDTDTVIYKLIGTNRGSFDIAPGTGQISVGVGTNLDYERIKSYRVTVRAVDPSGDDDDVVVTIEVTNVEEAPDITGGDTEIEYDENASAQVGATYTATDDEDRVRNKSVKWSVSDTANFAIGNTTRDRGRLTFKSPPDYENPTSGVDAGTPEARNTYTVIITATDNGTEDDPNELKTTTTTVTITVINRNEPGTVTLSILQPLEGVALTATLIDPDGKADADGNVVFPIDDELTSDATWQWERSSNGSTGWQPVDGDDEDEEDDENASYTPDEHDVTYYLRATPTYTDGHGKEKTTEKVSANSVKKNLVNDTPVFNYAEGNMYTDDNDDIIEDDDVSVGEEIPNDNKIIREVEENSETDTPVGDPVAAYDDDEDVLTYTLSGTDDDGLFTIDRGTGQIRVGTEKFNASTDTPISEGNNAETYTVTVTAADPSHTSITPSQDSITVTIMVTDVKEAPELDDPTEMAGHTAKDHAENTATTTKVSTYTATDDEDDTTPMKWSLSGADMDHFELCDPDESAMCDSADSNTVDLRFKESPDFEAPADGGRNNVYNVTVVVTDSDEMTASRDVAVTVTNVEEDGTVTLSNRQPEVGIPITAKLTDPDGGETGVAWEWHWEDSDTGDVRNIIRGAKSDTYTPVSDDQGKWLRAMATYTDNAMNPEDTPKDDAESVSDFIVQEMAETNETPQFPDQDPDTSGETDGKGGGGEHEVHRLRCERWRCGCGHRRG